MRAVALLLLLGRAPYQCASDPDPNYRVEETASEALAQLAEHFAERDPAVRIEILCELVRKYPRSVEATRARSELGDAECVRD